MANPGLAALLMGWVSAWTAGPSPIPSPAPSDAIGKDFRKVFEDRQVAVTWEFTEDSGYRLKFDVVVLKGATKRRLVLNRVKVRPDAPNEETVLAILDAAVPKGHVLARPNSTRDGSDGLTCAIPGESQDVVAVVHEMSGKAVRAWRVDPKAGRFVELKNAGAALCSPDTDYSGD